MSTPILTDERVEAMRSTVMQAVERDITRRGRRVRQTIGLTAASVVVIAFGGLGLSALGGLQGGGSSGDSVGANQKAPAESAAGDAGASRMSGAAEDAAGSDEAVETPEREVITTGEISMTVKQPRAVAQQISAYVEQIGGRVDNRSESGSGDDAAAYVTVRVPSTEVTATIDRLGRYGTVDHVSLQNDDVTAQAKDLDARIDALRLSIDRLERILADADTSGELIKAETALTQRQEQLESLEAQRKGMADRVSLSTLSIDISQTARADSVEPGGFTGGLRDGWNGLVASVNNVVEVAGVLLPWLAIVAVAYGAWRLITRRRSRS